MGPDKTAICPLGLSLISKLDKPVRTNIPIQADKILKHYLEHELFEDIAPI